MNLIRTAFSTPKRLFLFPRCFIVIQQLSSTVNHTSKESDSVFNSWRDLLNNPTDWCDYREKKSIGSVKAKYPDFKHKTNGTALWLNTAPNWVLVKLVGCSMRKRSNEDSWKNLVLNPDKWLDNRPTKTNLKAPDFVHKDSGQGLWLDSTPKWVLAVPESLDVEAGKKEDSWMDLVENPDKWWDKRSIRSGVSCPDFMHKETNEGLWLDSSPEWVLAMLEELNVGKGKKEDSWKNLLENPDKWWDNRQRKNKVNSPDFRHKETGEGLWLDNAPKWVLSQLPC